MPHAFVRIRIQAPPLPDICSGIFHNEDKATVYLQQDYYQGKLVHIFLANPQTNLFSANISIVTG